MARIAPSPGNRMRKLTEPIDFTVHSASVQALTHSQERVVEQSVIKHDSVSHELRPILNTLCCDTLAFCPLSSDHCVVKSSTTAFSSTAFVISTLPM